MMMRGAARRDPPRGRPREGRLDFYDFEVLRGDQVISAERSVPLYSTRAAWPKIIKLAKGLKAPGCRIRVKQGDETIILVGASVALRYVDFDFAAAAA